MPRRPQRPPRPARGGGRINPRRTGILPGGTISFYLKSPSIILWSGYNLGKPLTVDNVLTDQEIDQILRAVKTPLEEFLVKGLLYTGLRVSEFIHMKQSWVDFRRWRLTVPREQPCNCRECREANFNGKGRMTKPPGVWRPKTSAGMRTVPIVPEARDAFEWFFDHHDAVRDIWPYRQYVNHRLSRIVERTGIDHPVFPHAMRGTFATLLADRDFSPFEIRDACGWKTLQPAIHYVKIAGERLSQAFDEKWSRG